MTRRQLKRRIRKAWSEYEGTLRRLLHAQGRELGGLAAAHEILGQPAEDAYETFKRKQRGAQAAYGADIDFAYNAKEAERKARDTATQAVKQAQHDVAYFTEYLERERVRARAVVEFAGFTEAQAAQIVADAQAKLDEATGRLEALR